MKKLIMIALLIFCGHAYAQKLPDMGLYKVRITESNKTILAEMDPINNSPKPKPGLIYYWYSANTIHSTQSGFSGKLLNGKYEEFYLNKNLKEQGSFKKGLKDGIWRAWDEDGKLTDSATWKSGTILVWHPSKFWNKVNLLKKIGHHHPDTTAKSN